MKIDGGNPAGSLERAIDLLLAILRDGGRSSLGAIAARVDLPLSTAHRQVALLERRGLVIRAERGRYITGLALASSVPAQAMDLGLTAAGRPVLKQLTAATGYTSHLGVLRSDMVTYLIKEAPAGLHVFTRETMQLEAYCSGLGKMLLAHLPEEALSVYLRQGAFVPLTAQTITDPAMLVRHLGTVREQDYAFDDREIADDLNCLAVPVRRPDGAVIAAISLSANASLKAQISVLVVQLKAAARVIERSMSPAIGRGEERDTA